MAFRRRRLTVLLLALAVLAAGLAFAAWRAGEWLRDEIERRLQEYLVPPVKLAGPVGWSLLPRPAVVVDGLAVGEREPLLAVGRIRVEAAPDFFSAPVPTLALLRVERLEARLARDPAGHWNVTDWLRPTGGTGDGGVPLLRIERLELEDIRLRVEDAQGGTAGDFQFRQLVADPLAWDETAGVSADGRLTLRLPWRTEGGFRLETRLTPAGEHVRLQDLRLELEGQGADWDASAEFALAHAGLVRDGAVDASGAQFSLRLQGAPGPMELQARVDGVDALPATQGAGWHGRGLSLDLSITIGEAPITTRFAADELMLRQGVWQLPAGVLDVAAPVADRGTLAVRMPLSGEGGIGEEGASVALRTTDARLDLPHPGDSARSLTVHLDGDLRLAQARLAGEVAGGFDASRFRGGWEYRAADEPPLALTLALDRLDLDRYLPPGPADSEPPMLDAWLDWPLRGVVTVGELHYRGIVGRDVRLRLGEAQGGR